MAALTLPTMELWNEIIIPGELSTSFHAGIMTMPESRVKPCGTGTVELLRGSLVPSELLEPLDKVLAGSTCTFHPMISPNSIPVKKTKPIQFLDNLRPLALLRLVAGLMTASWWVSKDHAIGQR